MYVKRSCKAALSKTFIRCFNTPNVFHFSRSLSDILQSYPCYLGLNGAVLAAKLSGSRLWTLISQRSLRIITIEKHCFFPINWPAADAYSITSIYFLYIFTLFQFMHRLAEPSARRCNKKMSVFRSSFNFLICWHLYQRETPGPLAFFICPVPPAAR